jgi:hypothetical protein
MSTKKTTKKSNWGGARKRAGHPKTGITKTKICISVTERIWDAALNRWNGKGSQLVDRLLARFVARKATI